MTNQTETTTPSLLERFNSDTPENPNSERSRLECELMRLLNKGVEQDTNSGYRRGELSPEEIKLLAEYTSTFTWETKYRVDCTYEVIGSYDHSINCKDLAEVKSYLNGEKELPDSEELTDEGVGLEDFTLYDDFDNVGRPSADIFIYNLQPKPQAGLKTFSIEYVQTCNKKTWNYEAFDSEEAIRVFNRNIGSRPHRETEILSVKEVEVS